MHTAAESDAFLECIHDRMSRIVALQVTSEGERAVRDPGTGRIVRVMPARRHRPGNPSTPDLGKGELSDDVPSPFAEGEAGPIVFYVFEESGSLTVKPGAETASLRKAADLLEARYGRKPTPWERLGNGACPTEHLEVMCQLAPEVRAEMEHRDYRDYVVACVLNCCPIETTLPGNSAVIFANPEFASDFFDQLPPRVAAGLVKAWQVVEEYAEWLNRHANDLRREHPEWGNDWDLPFRMLAWYNGGKHSGSGQSQPHPHGQASWERLQPIFEAIQAQRETTGRCPVCQLLAEASKYRLNLYKSSNLMLCVHPVPIHNYRLLVAPTQCVQTVGELDPWELAEVLQMSVRLYRREFGRLAPWNLGIRAGEEVHHAHCDLVARPT